MKEINRRNNGKYFETLVAILEKSINPSAKIEHDVLLPVLGSSIKRTRQCDVVITDGKPGRETITIVEVQDRKSRIKINEFLGWVRKMEEVGAQHLICVSRHDYSESILEEVMKRGNTIRLIQLSDECDSTIPLNIIYSTFNVRGFEIVGIENIEFRLSEKLESQIIHQLVKENTEFKFLELGTGELQSLSTFCERHFLTRDKDTGTCSISINTDTSGIRFKLNEMIESGHMKFDLTWNRYSIEVPINTLTYNQFGTTMGWIAEGKYSGDFGTLGFSFGITPNGENYNISILPTSLNIPNDSSLQIRVNQPT